MTNQFVLVGKIANKTKLGEDEKNRKTMTITIAVPRIIKNEKGEYDTDFLEVKLYGGIAENVDSYLEIGGAIGVKGRLARLENETLQIVAEKVTYLSSKGE